MTFRILGTVLAVLLAWGTALGAASPAAAAPSLYDLKVELTNQSDEAVGLDVHRDHPTIATMFYATCPHACPALISDLKRIDGRLSEATRARTRYLLVSFDASGDSPEVLAGVAKLHDLDLERFTLARAHDDTAVRRVAAVLGITYRRLEDGSFNHTSIFTVLDGNGTVKNRVEGLGLAHDDTVAALEAVAVAEPASEVVAAPPAID